ncbi:hypothetical protein DDF62_15825 [Caulobacter radicis]|nr:hypothetical protein DDF62_15825 [Caulobacter radicis]
MLSVALALLLAATPSPPSALQPTSLAGDWVVDLSASDSAPYFKGMSLVLEDDGRVTGSFYDSAIEAGRWRTARSRICVSFRTSDGKGPYHTTACLRGGAVEGQTWAEHRNFVFLWSAKPATPADRAAPWW